MPPDPAAQLLQQIGDLIQQYLALGPDTPLAQTFSQVLPEIEQGMQEVGGQEAPQGAAPVDQGQGMTPDMMGALMGQSAEEPPLTGNAKMDFGNASKQAAKDFEETGSYGKKKKPKAKKEKAQASK